MRSVRSVCVCVCLCMKWNCEWMMQLIEREREKPKCDSKWFPRKNKKLFFLVVETKQKLAIDCHYHRITRIWLLICNTRSLFHAQFLIAHTPRSLSPSLICSRHTSWEREKRNGNNNKSCCDELSHSQRNGTNFTLHTNTCDAHTQRPQSQQQQQHQHQLKLSSHTNNRATTGKKTHNNMQRIKAQKKETNFTHALGPISLVFYGYFHCFCSCVECDMF